MKTIESYFENMENIKQKERMETLIHYIQKEYPFLDLEIKWNQPMFINNGTFIIGFSYSKKHIAVALEKAALDHFTDLIKERGFKHSKMLFYFPWDKDIDYEMLKTMIDYNIEDKKGYKTFWR
jgi:uncharacterized protein YdhG (YjbR/CyaY superfamily)